METVILICNPTEVKSTSDTVTRQSAKSYKKNPEELYILLPSTWVKPKEPCPNCFSIKSVQASTLYIFVTLPHKPTILHYLFHEYSQMKKIYIHIEMLIMDW